MKRYLPSFLDELEKIAWAPLIPAALRIAGTVASVGGALFKKKGPKPPGNVLTSGLHRKPLGS